MKPGELKARRRKKALDRLASSPTPPSLRTTDALYALEAGCGAVRFHRILHRRGHATPIEGFDKGYEFDLPQEYGGGTFSVNHHSFQWKPAGVAFMANILREEGIPYCQPEQLLRWL